MKSADPVPGGRFCWFESTSDDRVRLCEVSLLVLGGSNCGILALLTTLATWEVMLGLVLSLTALGGERTVETALPRAS